MDDAAKSRFYQLKCQSFHLQLVEESIIFYTENSLTSLQTTAERTVDAARAISAKRELGTRVETIRKELEEEQKGTFELTQDMTRQYKGMQEELLSRVIILMITTHNEISPLTDALNGRSTIWKT